MDVLNSKKIALIATDGFEDSELTVPLQAMKDTGAEVTVISDHEGEIKGKNDTSIPVNATVDEVDADDYDGLIIPGGVKNPDVMRTNEGGVSFVRDFFEQNKPVAAICHGPWLLVEADVLKGRRVTSWPSLKTDIRNAGGEWVDEEVVTDQGLVTSRKPDDLEAFCDKAVEEFAKGKHVAQTI
ncbi:MAG TPA: type 1 glutamine amidotransferase domain-containing protein [Candidatus Saccharimonadales bacterium]|nr:type 1 glutamine amidotransferase domain-containing protein [Candidatus Saccharimonadales bacterium]